MSNNLLCKIDFLLLFPNSNFHLQETQSDFKEFCWSQYNCIKILEVATLCTFAGISLSRPLLARSRSVCFHSIVDKCSRCLGCCYAVLQVFQRHYTHS